MNMNPITRRPSFVIFIILAVLITAFIFSNSLKNGEQSNAQSAVIVEFVERILDPQDKVPTKTFNLIVRKAAHIMEFSALGIILGCLVCSMHVIQKPNFFLTVGGIGLTVAAADEIIQSFTGRTNSVTDVLIDFVGVAIGTAIAWLLCRWRQKKSKRAMIHNCHG